MSSRRAFSLRSKPKRCRTNPTKQEHRQGPVCSTIWRCFTIGNEGTRAWVSNPQQRLRKRRLTECLQERGKFSRQIDADPLDSQLPGKGRSSVSRAWQRRPHASRSRDSETQARVRDHSSGTGYLKKGYSFLRQGIQVRYRFVAQEHQSYPVERLCRVMSVSRSGFYAWQRRPPSDRAQRDELLTRHIRHIHQQHRSIYGAPRVHAELHAQDIRCSRKRVARLMRSAGLGGKVKGDKKPKRSPPSTSATNLLRTHGAVTKPDQVWVSDITYLHTGEGWLYLAVVIDAYSRKVIGWAMRERLTATLTLAAFEMAYRQRRPRPGLICHSDRGSQYTCAVFQHFLKTSQARFSTAHSCYENALAESFFATLKSEEAQGYPSREVAKRYLFDYLETFYNRKRRHSSLGYHSPAAFEELAAQRCLTDCLQ